MNANPDGSSELTLIRQIAMRLTGPVAEPHEPPRGFVRLRPSLATVAAPPAKEPERTLASVPRIDAQYGSYAWRDWLSHVKRAVGASLVFAADGYGLVVEHDGGGHDLELDAAAAMLSVLLQQMARFGELTHGFPTVVVALEDQWLSGCAVPWRDSVLSLGEVSDTPVEPSDWRFLARRLAEGSTSTR